MIKTRYFSIKINQKIMNFDTPKVMGIINATPDSFYNNSRKIYVDDALIQVKNMLNDGADILDIGGYSSRPGAEHISEQEETNRILPIIESVKKQFPQSIISVDTFRSNVAKVAIKEGADIINDISGGSLDTKMFETVHKLDVPYIMMHMRGTPQNMNENTLYKNGVTQDVIKYFAEKKVEFMKGGNNDIIIDPGFGFSKTLEQNYELLNNLELFQSLNLPILIGASRKSMINKVLNTTPQEALNGTSIINTIALMKKANILRVHDVKPAIECVKLIQQTVSF